MVVAVKEEWNLISLSNSVESEVRLCGAEESRRLLTQR